MVGERGWEVAWGERGGQWHGEREGGSGTGRERGAVVWGERGGVGEKEREGLEGGGGSGRVYKKHTANEPTTHTHTCTIYVCVSVRVVGRQLYSVAACV